MTIWAVVPAAGVGSRMLSSTPKQYLPIKDQTVLAHTLARLSAIASIQRIILVLNPHDTHWSSLQATGLSEDEGTDNRIMTCHGGEDRWQSVLNGLQALSAFAEDDDWVLVHDGVRPCVRVADVLSLLEITATDEVGGLLAVPVSDTLKRAIRSEEGLQHVATTVDRQAMWCASTPQLFRLGMLRRCLQDAATAGVVLTDEASALEWAGYRPVLVPCHKDNIKITHPDDLMLAELILDAQIQGHERF